MSSIIDYIHTLPELFALQGTDETQISQAESRLGTHFDAEYRDYLSAFGCISYGIHELTGLCASTRLNVVNATQAALTANPDIPRTYYVIEEIGMDDTLIWQSPEGEVYMSVPGESPSKIANGLLDYLRGTVGRGEV